MMPGGRQESKLADRCGRADRALGVIAGLGTVIHVARRQLKKKKPPFPRASLDLLGEAEAVS
jgi:hypothetical protein